MTKEEMPKSCETVLSKLEVNGAQTPKDLIQATGLAPRTVRFALRRLKEEGLIVEKFNFRDARQSLYSLKVAEITTQTVTV